MEHLSGKALYKMRQELRNTKKLHAAARSSNAQLQAELKEVRVLVAQQAEEITNLKILVEELRTMLFKKKKGDDDEHNDPFGGTPKKKPKSEKPPRGKESYQRALPQEEEITEHVPHDLSVCPDCSTLLTKKKKVTFYVEDIPLPAETTSLKQVTAHHVEKGYCPSCKKWKTATPLPTTRVVLGKQVRLYICYLSLLLRCSFEQIRHLLRDMYGFAISDGEIRNILFHMAERLQPEYHTIGERLRTSSGVHLDETGGGQHTYVWIMTAIEGEDTLFLAGRTRGKGNAEVLLGPAFAAPRVSDCFPAYRNLPGQLAWCWAHPFRKLRDLVDARTLSKEIHAHVLRAYEQFQTCYALVEETRRTPYEKKQWGKTKEKVRTLLKAFALPKKKDPEKLRKIRAQFSGDLAPWLLCLELPHVPADNNKAERGLRHIVLKRKISFGNKSEKGYKAFEINMSVFLTYWKTFKDNFFPKFQLLLEGL